MQYISCEEMGEKLGLSRRRVQQLCAQGKIPGAEKIGRDWLIPAAPGVSSSDIQKEIRFLTASRFARCQEPVIYARLWLNSCGRGSKCIFPEISAVHFRCLILS